MIIQWVPLWSLLLFSCAKISDTEPDFRDITVQEAVILIQQDPAVVVLDIRTPQEFQHGHIAAAKNLDFRRPDFEQALQQMDRDKTYLLHCASGGRSTRALPSFSALNFKRIYHLKQGMNGWLAAGQPVEY